MTSQDPTQSTFNIRPLRESDCSDWLQLWNAYLQFYEADVSQEVTDATWRRLCGGDGHQAMVCVERTTNELIGFVTYLFHPSTWTLAGYCYLEDLFVDSSSRGKGAGRELIQAVVAVASESKISRVYWHTNTENAVARWLYDSIGELADVVQYRITNKQ